MRDVFKYILFKTKLNKNRPKLNKNRPKLNKNRPKLNKKSAETQQNYFSQSTKSIQKLAKTQQKKILGKKLKTEMEYFIFIIFSHTFACI